MQTSAVGGGNFTIEWVKLASGSTEDVLLAPDTMKFSDIFEAVAPQNATCPESFVSIQTTRGCECLKLKAGMEMHAAFFETRR